MRRILLIGLVFVGLTRTLEAQIAFDAATYGGEVTATSQTTSHTVGSSGVGRCMIVIALGDATSDLLTTATYNGVSMTLIDEQNANPGAVYWQHIWALANPSTGANNVVVNASSSSHIETIVGSWTGVAAAGCPQVSSEGTGSGDPYVASVTTVTAANWTVEGINASVGLVASTNFTSRAANPSATYFLADSNAAVAIGSNSMSVTGAGGTKQHLIMALAPLTGRCCLLGVP